jgi:hypothetical protein
LRVFHAKFPIYPVMWSPELQQSPEVQQSPELQPSPEVQQRVQQSPKLQQHQPTASNLNPFQSGRSSKTMQIKWS